MREMKDSGAKWIGDIPINWQADKLKYHLVRKEPKNPGGKVVLSLYREYGVIPKDSRDDNHNQTSEDTSKYKYVVPGCLVVNKMKAWQGSVAVSDYDGIVSPAYYVYEFIDNVFFKRYFHYLLRGCYKDEFMRLSGGMRVGQWDLSSEDLNNTLVIIPPLPEQQKIAAYLDSKCAEIDGLIADIQSQIDTLEQYKRSVISEAVTKGVDGDATMVDSNIDYIGLINSSWTLSRIGYICIKLNRGFSSEAEALICSNKGEVIIRGENNYGLVSDNDNMFQGVMSGDLLIHGMDTWHGAVAVSHLDGKCTTVVHVCDTNQNKEFVSYYLQMLAFKKVYKAISNGVRGNTSDFRSWDKVKKIYISLPDKDEQDRIAQYLTKKCSEISEIIKTKKEQISTLEAYKKSVIYEYVTGKKEFV